MEPTKLNLHVCVSVWHSKYRSSWKRALPNNQRPNRETTAGASGMVLCSIRTRAGGCLAQGRLTFVCTLTAPQKLKRNLKAVVAVVAHLNWHSGIRHKGWNVVQRLGRMQPQRLKCTATLKGTAKVEIQPWHGEVQTQHRGPCRKFVPYRVLGSLIALW